MTVATAGVSACRGYLNQAIVVMLMNVPTVSFGLTMGWVSLASGERDGEGGAGDADLGQVVLAAGTTFLSALAAVPLAARALHAGRKFTVIATSLVFAACWALKLAGGRWWVVVARVLAGMGGTAAWAITPVLAREMCAQHIRGAAVSSLVLAHNLGFMLMYLAADLGVEHKTLWMCLVLSLGHCMIYSFMPESPSYLAAHGDLEGARSALAWLRGTSGHATALDAEMETLPPLDDPKLSSLKVVKNLLSSAQRQRALVVSTLAVMGQEACGVFALLQFAERVFVLARDEVVADNAVAVAGREMLHAMNVTREIVTSGVNSTDMSNMMNVSGLWALTDAPTQQSTLASPARHAVVLGAVQLAASCLALYFVERIGRRPLIIMTGLATAACLGVGAGALWLGTGVRADLWTTLALAGAVGFDSAGLQPAPYAVLADMFHYEYRSCAVMVATAAACAGNAVEVLVFPLVAGAGGVRAALALSAALTLLYVAFVAGLVPETRGKTPDEIYEELGPPLPPFAKDARDISPQPVRDVKWDPTSSTTVAAHTESTNEMTHF